MRAIGAFVFMIVGSGCVAEDPTQTVQTVADQMAADGIDVEILEPTGTCTCYETSQLSPDCDYMYFSASAVCVPGGGGLFDWVSLETADSMTAYYGPRVMNISESGSLPMVCTLLTVFENLEGYPPEALHHVAVYGRRYPGAGSFSVTYNAAGLYDTAWDFQEYCDFSSTSSSIQATYCNTEPLSVTQFLQIFEVQIPARSAYTYESYLNAFRLCYDPDGW